MKATRFSGKALSGLLCGGAFCIAFSLPAAGQVKSDTSVEHGPATKQVTVQRGEIVFISGDSVVIKMEDGEFRNFEHVSDGVSFMVDGKPVNIHNAKVGMKLEKQVVTTSTPRVITTVETVTGKVWSVQPPNWVILTMDNNQNQKFNIPKGQMFTVDGKQTDAFGLKKGMVVSAQKVTEVPETVVAQEFKRTGKMPPPPPAPAQNVPILVVYAPAPGPAPVETAPAEPAPKKLPKTASDVPLIGLLGALLCAGSLTGMVIRKTASLLSGSRA
jgi:hypothetical protein